MPELHVIAAGSLLELALEEMLNNNKNKLLGVPKY